jgi:hypothetical protein
MIWVRKVIIPAEWNEVQDQFESLFVKHGCPGQMMLVAATGAGPPILFASLPNLSSVKNPEPIGTIGILAVSPASDLQDCGTTAVDFLRFPLPLQPGI